MTDAQDLETLKKQRSRAKASITRIESFVTGSSDDTDVHEFIVRESQLVKHYERYLEIQDKIEDKDETLVQDRVEVEGKYFSLVAKLKSLIALRQSTTLMTQSNDSSPRQQHAGSVGGPQHCPPMQVKLPQINIPIFSGKLEEYFAFSDLFSAVIGNNDTLSDVQRLIYLRSLVKGEPLALIESLPLTKENYGVALSLLHGRYNKRISVINAHLKGLLDVPQISKNNVVSMRQFLTQINRHLKALAALDVPTHNWDLLLVYIYSTHLDFAVRQAFELERDDSKLPSLNEFLSFLEKRCSTLETLVGESNTSPKLKRQGTSCLSREPYGNKESPQTLFTNKNNNEMSGANYFCLYCKVKNHNIYKCVAFSKLSVGQRKEFVDKSKLCFNCLGSKHQVKQCASSGCRWCARKHHSLLHDATDTNYSRVNGNSSAQPTHLHKGNTAQGNQTQATARFNEAQSISNDQEPHQGQASQSQQANRICMTSLGKTHHILLATAQVMILAKNGKKIQARALLDSASQTSFVTTRLFHKLNCPAQRYAMPISGIGATTTQVSHSVHLTVLSHTHKEFSVSSQFAILDTITCVLPHVAIDKGSLPIPEDLTLADNEFFKPMPIDVLIGADLYFDIIAPGLLRLGRNLPTLQFSYLGWIIGGPAPIGRASEQSALLSVALFSSTMDINEIIPKFWSLEEPPKNAVVAPEDKLCESIFENTTRHLPGGRFQVDIPFSKGDIYNRLGDSFSIAFRRLRSLEKRLSKDHDTFLRYKEFIDEYVRLGHAKYVSLSHPLAEPQRRNFLAHHGVFREQSISTKLRVVFDASMKTSSGMSLNDMMLKGPRVQPDLFDIICRFRLHRYVFTTDIQKMYRQIMVNPAQTHLQSILWRENANDAVKVIELLTVTYGTKAAPYLATRCLTELAKEHALTYPLAAQAVINQCYVDDILAGANTLTEIRALRSELVAMLGSAGFTLHKWCFNELSLYGLSNTEGCSEVTLKDESNKVLGLVWKSVDDVFTISAQPNLEQAHGEPLTKRSVLAKLAQHFDPLGFISPVIVRAKILMQRIWVRNLGWDDAIPTDLATEWQVFAADRKNITKIRVPRWLHTPEVIEDVQLHGFCDASQVAYGAVLYLRSTYVTKSIGSQLICAKSRVAPLKIVSLPRLELCAALLLSKLVAKIKEIWPYSFNKIVLWTDSQIVLAWLSASPSRWTTFVANRTAEIQELTSSCQWRHIDSKLNIADIITRGCDCDALIANRDWWQGPQLIMSDYQLQTSQPNSESNSASVPEQRSNAMLAQTNQNFFQTVISKFSNFSRLQRTVAYVLRFIHNCLHRATQRTGPLSVEEVHQALETIVKVTQRTYFKKELDSLTTQAPLKNNPMQSLAPFVDGHGILRVGGRLHNASVTFNQKHPVLLPAKNHLVTLIIDHEHRRLGHAGAQQVLASIRLRFWPLNALRQVKSVLHHCVICFRFKAARAEQLMGTLPSERVSGNRPFLNTGLDFGGPVMVKPSHSRKAAPYKAYIALFVCMHSRAIHLELVSSLSAEAFLSTLKRFISRRGKPAVLYSDNATNFRGANNALKEVYHFFNSKDNLTRITDYATNSEIQWKFIPPRSPHWGGLWEAGIKSTKFHLRRIVGSSLLTFENLSTVLTEIEAILNSRPICPLSTDPLDLAALTPGHFLIGQPLTAVPELNTLDTPHNRLTWWQQITKVKQTFWKRFSVEYLNRLQHRPKWYQAGANLVKDTLVLVRDDNAPPLLWRLGRIQRAMPGPDGRVRVVEVRTTDGIFVRPIAKLAPLPLDSP